MAQPLERGHHLVEHLSDAERFAAALGRDGVVQVKNVHPLHAEPPQAALEGFGYRLVDAGEIGGGQPHLGADDCAFGLELPERAAEILFRLAVAVLDRGVEIIDAGFERPGDRPLLVGRGAAYHQPAHRAAAEPQDRDPQAGPAEVSHLHRGLLCGIRLVNSLTIITRASPLPRRGEVAREAGG